MQRIRCNIASVTPFCDTVFKVILTPSQPVTFAAGQYLTVVMSDEDKRPFSIASSPVNGEQLELHIGAAVAESYAMQVIEAMQSRDSIEVELPFGDAYLRQDLPRPRLLIAGGTGFSYINSIMETLIAAGDTTTTFLYWGCRDQASMYQADKLARWAEHYPHLTVVPVFDEAVAGQRQGTVIDAVCSDFISLGDYDVYIAGRFEMAGAAREAFREKGVDERRLFGDAFAYIK
ncbi:aquacobalamin reductase / NAD(P)H-flavin reductase [Ferrimonas sediminum]|uniref:Aquacobalamin reductase / NAD(P)H-flavin reductase n=1 Tax=Ferrimonas sediminum TaxID=718193 RepID=A0A1G8K012_9GAMM|nr:NAD(P)H-flavin reductase [Ferrimonas sediminum]SDI36792.1 aquacobalamin reductase / NAD(P)H-flavin reductase [Ferrimonas sediminum]